MKLDEEPEGTSRKFLMLAKAAKSTAEKPPTIFIKSQTMTKDAFNMGLLKMAVDVGIDGQEFWGELKSAPSHAIVVSLCNAVKNKNMENFKELPSLDAMNKYVENVKRNSELFDKLARESGLDLSMIRAINKQMQVDIKGFEDACYEREIAGIISK